ncbi:hypothetical protein [Veillonella montpellierensis]|uniref:hypothetical protein n=1 Tax=Veillonella montpellierensis TaxID=187328 RepID=UPI0023F92915|nr:hypothetical protein [Veillonella montpellierensis]
MSQVVAIVPLAMVLRRVYKKLVPCLVYIRRFMAIGHTIMAIGHTIITHRCELICIVYMFLSALVLEDDMTF